MLAFTEITAWHWAGFIAGILLFLSLDLGVFHRRAHAVTFREALCWTTFFFSMAMLFALSLVPTRGKVEATEFLTGYIIELSLSMDNVFVIALIFSYFRVPLQYQHRVLFWGILGAMIMRGIMIWIGIELITRFEWMLYVFGGFLILTGIKMVFSDQEGVHPERNPIIRVARRLFPVATEFSGQKFFIRLNGKKVLTPLALVLLMVETTDLIFAVDSIPAIFAVTQKPFIVFTSNVFAILGLRSLYFLLANAIVYFRYLKFGLSIVLVFVGAKMLVTYFDAHIRTDISLLVVIATIAASILWSVAAARRERRQKAKHQDLSTPKKQTTSLTA
jgi:tellurite resistance protein TerC